MPTKPTDPASAEERSPEGQFFKMRRQAFAWLVSTACAPPILALLAYLYFRFGPQNFPAMLILVSFCSAVTFPGLGLWFAQYPTIVVTGEGLWGRDLWGRMRFSPWDSVRESRPSRFLGVAMIRYPVPNSWWSAWIPRWVVRQRAMERALAVLSPVGHPIRGHFGVNEASAGGQEVEERSNPTGSRAVAWSAIAVNLMLYAFVLFIAASSYLRRHANPIWDIAENQPYLFPLDLLYSFAPGLSVLVAAAALIGRPWWAPLVALGVNSALAALLGAGATINFVALNGAGLEAAIPTPVFVMAALAVVGSALVCSPAALGGFKTRSNSSELTERKLP